MQKTIKTPINFTTHQKSSKSIFFLPAILLLLFYTASFQSTNQVQATQKALQFGIIFLVLVSCMYLPNGLIERPTVLLWKAITGISFFYLAILIYFSYQDKSSVLQTIRTYFDSSLKKYDYEQISYATDCRIYTPEKEDPYANVRFAFFDLFAFAHAAGWFIKTLVVRDLKLIVFQSVIFQVLQYSLRNVLNNFKECWWDHVIVDIFGCNLLGIVLGFYVIDKFKLERYKWSFRDAPIQSNTMYQIKYFFTHWDLSQLQMKSFSSLKKYLQLTWFTLFFQLNDLSVFFLKYVYELPPSNYMVTLRVIIIGLLCVNASKQFYRYLIRREKVFKINCFMVHMIVLTEIFLILKHGRYDFDHAYFSPLGYFYLCLLASFFLLLFIKILISDLINFKKAAIKCTKIRQPVKKPYFKSLSKIEPQKND